MSNSAAILHMTILITTFFRPLALYDTSMNCDNWKTYFCAVFTCCHDSPLPLGPPVGGVWAGHSACPSAHTVLGW